MRLMRHIGACFPPPAHRLALSDRNRQSAKRRFPLWPGNLPYESSHLHPDRVPEVQKERASEVNGRRLEANEANPSPKSGLNRHPFASRDCPISPSSEGVPLGNRPIRFKKVRGLAPTGQPNCKAVWLMDRDENLGSANLWRRS